MKTLIQLREELQVKNERLVEVWKQAGDDRDFSKVTLEGCETDQEKVAKVREYDAEINDLGKQVDEAMELEKMQKDTLDREKLLNTAVKSVVHPIGGDGVIIGKDGQAIMPKALGELFVESKAYKGRRGNIVEEETYHEEKNLSLKTLFETTAGFAPESIRSGLILPAAVRPLQVTDIVPSGAINQAIEKYMEQTTRTNTAAETSEGGTFNEATFEYTERTEAVVKITISLPVTDEQLEDEARISSIVTDDLMFMLRQRLDDQLTGGNGVSPNITGYLNKSGVLTQVKNADPVPDAIFKLMTQIRVTGRAVPTAAILHPNDWQEIRLLRTSTGIYIWGSPSESTPERIWGIPIVQADALSEGTGIVGDFSNPIYSQLLIRRGITLKVTDSNASDFVAGKQMIRADIRLAFVIRRAAAFGTVSGI